MKLKYFIGMVLGSLILVGCGSKYATNGETLYLKSRNGPGLNVPPPLTRANLSNFYQLPHQDNPDPAVNIEPPGMPS